MCSWQIVQGKSYIRAQKSLNKFKETEITSAIFSNHNGMKLNINYKKKAG